MLEGFRAPEGIIVCYQRSVLEHSRTIEILPDVPSSSVHRGLYTLPSTSHRVGVLGGFGFGARIGARILPDLPKRYATGCSIVVVVDQRRSDDLTLSREGHLAEGQATLHPGGQD